MNERIKELILEADFPKFDKMYVVSDGEELEKFADLIVKECCDIIKEDKRINWNDSINLIDAIKDNFGVE